MSITFASLLAQAPEGLAESPTAAEIAKAIVEQFKDSPEFSGAISPDSQPGTAVVIGYFVILILAGAFGGFVSTLDPKLNYQLRRVGLNPDKEGKPIELGWVGGILIGMAAAIGIMLIGDTFGVLRGTGFEPFQLLRLAALGIIAGYVGHSLLGGLGKMLQDIAEQQVEQRAGQLQEKIEEEGQKVLAINEAVSEADRLLQGREYDLAKVAYEKLEKRFPDQRLRAQKGVANCLAYLGRESDDGTSLAEADKLLEGLNTEFPDKPEVAYNQMWVRVLISELDREQGKPPTYSIDELRRAIERAIELDPDSERWARYEPDLQSLMRREPTIAALVGGVPNPPGSYKWKAGNSVFHRPECDLVEQGDDWKDTDEPPFKYAPCSKCLP